MESCGGKVILPWDHPAQSETAWRQQKRKRKADAQPCGYKSAHHKEWPVYTEDQTEPMRQVQQKPPQKVDILAAVWTVNRYAKRMRDKAAGCYSKRAHSFASDARCRKEEAYALKNQVLAHLLNDRVLQVQGYHRFGDDLYAYILGGNGYTFHQPCPAPEDPKGVEYRSDIEAKPKSAAECNLKDAMHTIKQFLSERPYVDVYVWPKRERPSRERRSDHWDLDDDEDDDVYGY